MESIALPLRFSPSGKLERVDSLSAILGLLSTMLATSEEAWPHASWFGLYEQARAINPSLEEQAGLRDSFNEGLEQLGVGAVRVDKVRARRGELGSGRVDFELTLDMGGKKVFSELSNGLPAGPR